MKVTLNCLDELLLLFATFQEPFFFVPEWDIQSQNMKIHHKHYNNLIKSETIIKCYKMYHVKLIDIKFTHILTCPQVSFQPHTTNIA